MTIEKTVHILINRTKYEFTDPHQTGKALKERAGIPLADVLFLDRPHEDEVVADDTKITLQDGEQFHSSPPANYGNVALDIAAVGAERFETVAQSDGWTFVILNDYPMVGYQPELARVLVKLPPTFPDAQPDMFWVSPHVQTSTGAAPKGTTTELVLGAQWQRFSWHLTPGSWRPGVSTLRDFMRCVRARIEKRD